MPLCKSKSFFQSRFDIQYIHYEIYTSNIFIHCLLGQPTSQKDIQLGNHHFHHLLSRKRLVNIFHLYRRKKISENFWLYNQKKTERSLTIRKKYIFLLFGRFGVIFWWFWKIWMYEFQICGKIYHTFQWNFFLLHPYCISISYGVH